VKKPRNEETIVNGALWVELSGEIIIARVRGEPTVELLAECQRRSSSWRARPGRTRVLYDVLEMHPPHVDVPWSQRALDEKLGDSKLRRAIVVPPPSWPISPLAFGEGDYRVFYNDIAAAVACSRSPLARRQSRRVIQSDTTSVRCPHGAEQRAQRLGAAGGFIDAGESPRQAAIRELAEEAGCVARPRRWLGLVEVNDGRRDSAACCTAKWIGCRRIRQQRDPRHRSLARDHRRADRRVGRVAVAKVRRHLRHNGAMQSTFDALAAFPGAARETLRGVSRDFVNWAPPSWDGVPSEAFTALEQVCHVRDIEIDGYQVRFRRTLDESSPTLAPSTARRWRSSATTRMPTRGACSRSSARRAAAPWRCCAARRGAAAAPAVFEGYGRVTLRGLVHYLCSHDQQHLSGLQWLLGKIDAVRA
jgi:8-oxo-dGTP pyrophosphatase MutT (NUDIX family)